MKKLTTLLFCAAMMAYGQYQGFGYTPHAGHPSTTAFVQGAPTAACTGAATCTVTYSANVASGSLIYVNADASTNTVTGTRGESFILYQTEQYFKLFVGVTTSAGAETITANNGGGVYGHLDALEFSNATLDNTAGGTNTDASPGVTLPGTAGDLAVLWELNTNGTPLACSGFTQVFSGYGWYYTSDASMSSSSLAASCTIGFSVTWWMFAASVL